LNLVIVIIYCYIYFSRLQAYILHKYLYSE